VELVIDESDWEPAAAIPGPAIDGVRVDIDEKKLQKRVKSVGGKWDPEGRLWHILYIDAAKPGLKSRVVKVIRNAEEAP